MHGIEPDGFDFFKASWMTLDIVIIDSKVYLLSSVIHVHQIDDDPKSISRVERISQICHIGPLRTLWSAYYACSAIHNGLYVQVG